MIQTPMKMSNSAPKEYNDDNINITIYFEFIKHKITTTPSLMLAPSPLSTTFHSISEKQSHVL